MGGASLSGREAAAHQKVYEELVERAQLALDLQAAEQPLDLHLAD